MPSNFVKMIREDQEEAETKLAAAKDEIDILTRKLASTDKIIKDYKAEVSRLRLEEARYLGEATDHELAVAALQAKASSDAKAIMSLSESWGQRMLKAEAELVSECALRAAADAELAKLRLFPVTNTYQTNIDALTDQVSTLTGAMIAWMEQARLREEERDAARFEAANSLENYTSATAANTSLLKEIADLRKELDAFKEREPSSLVIKDSYVSKQKKF